MADHASQVINLKLRKQRKIPKREKIHQRGLPLKAKFLKIFGVFILITFSYLGFQYVNGLSISGEELVLGLRTGMSKSAVESVLNTELRDPESIKYVMKNSYMETDGFVVLDFDGPPQLIAQKTIPPSLHQYFETQYAVTVFMNQKVLLAASFFNEKLYCITIEFDKFYKDEFERVIKEINDQSREKYNSKLSMSDSVAGAYGISWKKNEVDASAWVNPKFKILTMTFTNDVFLLSFPEMSTLQVTNHL